MVYIDWYKYVVVQQVRHTIYYLLWCELYSLVLNRSRLERSTCGTQISIVTVHFTILCITLDS